MDSKENSRLVLILNGGYRPCDASDGSNPWICIQNDPVWIPESPKDRSNLDLCFLFQLFKRVAFRACRIT